MHVLELPFRLRERDGRVVVRVERSNDPEDLGLPLVATSARKAPWAENAAASVG